MRNASKLIMLIAAALAGVVAASLVGTASARTAGCKDHPKRCEDESTTQKATTVAVTTAPTTTTARRKSTTTSTTTTTAKTTTTTKAGTTKTATTKTATTKAATTSKPKAHTKATARTKPAPSASTAAGANLVLTDKSFVCNSPVHYASVTVTIRNVSADAVLLRSGCTGSIGKLNVVQYHGDGVKVGNARNLTIGGGSIRCYAHDPGKHQDGIQALGGQGVTFWNMDVGCYSANNSQVWINDGAGAAGAGGVPTDIVFHGGKFDGKGSGAYGVAIVNSVSSGVENATICPNAHPVRALYVGAGAKSPVTSGTSVVSKC